jgi:hypothetical protein
MVDVSKLRDDQLVRLLTNRWNEAEPLWSEIEKIYESNKRIWQNNPEWLSKVPDTRSKARDNRIFMSTETVISNLTGRPSKPNVIPANETREAGIIADDLQDFFLAKYRDLHLKKEVRKGLRYLFFSRLIVMKVFWNPATDDFDQKAVKPTMIRFNPNATKEMEWAIEKVEEYATNLIERFPDKEESILAKTGGGTLEELFLRNPKIVYREGWFGDWVVYEYNGTILKTERHPYWDWGGVKMTEKEMKEIGKKPGKTKRVRMTKIKSFQDYRNKATETGEREYENYLYNHLDKPMPPYIFGTIFEEEDKPIGETSLIEQAASLQEAIDQRKRQFSDNAEMANGVWKIDTNLCSLSKADAQRAKANPRGIIYGAGVNAGVTRETGRDLPDFLQNDLVHSIAEIDNMFGTQPTSRGEQGTQETATGRAILREQSYQRLNELIDLVDSIHEQSYNWWFQMMKARYTENHFIKPIGATKARQVIDLTQDDLDEGIEIKIIPGQIMPEDRLFRGERMFDAAKAQMATPLDYFEAAEFDNPMDIAKRLEMYKINPFSILDMSDEDIAKIQKAQQMFGGGAQGGAAGGDQAKAQKISAVRQEAERLINSPEFKKLPPDQQKAAMGQIQAQLQALTQAK